MQEYKRKMKGEEKTNKTPKKKKDSISIGSKDTGKSVPQVICLLSIIFWQIKGKGNFGQL